MEGVKHDDGKLPWHLVPWDAVKVIVEVLKFGMRKYAARNWESGIYYSRLYAACIRHLTAWFQDGEDKDPETGISHLAHAACCILFLLAYVVRGKHAWDDRPIEKEEDEQEYTLGSNLRSVEEHPPEVGKKVKVYGPSLGEGTMAIWCGYSAGWAFGDKSKENMKVSFWEEV